MSDKSLMNPFVFGKIVEEPDFCSRADLAAELSSCIGSGQNVVVFGHRRVGKSSLVFNTCREFPARLPLLIDLFFSKDSAMFLEYCSNALFSFNNRRKGLLEKTLVALRRIRPQVEMDPQSGLPSLTLGAGSQSPVLLHQTIEDFFDFLGSEFKANQIVVCFDEFQSVLAYPAASELLAKIRAKVQYHKFPYLFTGSDRSGIRSIFIDPASPFYKSVRPLEVQGIPRGDFQPFLERRFSTGKRKIANPVWDDVFALEVPGDIQQMCAALWDCSRAHSTIDSTVLGRAYERIFAYEIEGFRSLLMNLTALQIKVLKRIAAVGIDDIYSLSSQQLIGASGSSIRRSVGALVKKWILSEDGDELYFNNPFLRRFLTTTNI